MTMPGEIDAAAFVAWVRSLDLAEIRSYAVELEAFENDGSEFGRFAAVALPIVRAVEFRTTLLEELGPAFEQAMPGESLEEFMEHASAINRFARDLGTDRDPLEIFAAALETSRAARAHDGDEGDR
jgi:hypothetical protein